MTQFSYEHREEVAAYASVPHVRGEPGASTVVFLTPAASMIAGHGMSGSFPLAEKPETSH